MNRIRVTLLSFACTISLIGAATPAPNPAPNHSGPVWTLPGSRDVELGGPLGAAYTLGIKRLSEPPYDSPVFLRSDVSFETNRVFVNYSGDISGRFMQVASLVSPIGKMTPPTLPEVLNDFGKYQKTDGHFGRDIDWNMPLEPESSNAKLLPILWGNSRLLVGLLEAYHAFGREDCLVAARRMGDFYIATASRFLDPTHEAEYRMTGTYAAGYSTCYFPGIEGLVLLYKDTHDERYLQQAERMADFFRRFDTLPVDHSHGNLLTHYGLLALYEVTGKPEYLARPIAQWRKAVENGYVWPMGGVGEKFQVSFLRDEGCSEADWLRLNLRLWELTGQTQFLDMAERHLFNHYAMNRTANGGYGHHEFICDPQGPLLMQPQFTEAVWCCTFHGLMGLDTLKSYVVVGSPKGVFVNFPVNATAPVQTGLGQWKVSVQSTEATLGRIQCRIHLDSVNVSEKLPEVFVRRPNWATQVTIEDGSGRKLRVREENGYLRLALRSSSKGEATVTFSGAPRIEDRRMQPVVLKPGEINRQEGVTLWVGPHLMLANVDKPRPVIMARTTGAGHIVLPSGNRFPLVAKLDAPEAQIKQTSDSSPALELAPWENIHHEASSAFVFDLVTMPDAKDVK